MAMKKCISVLLAVLLLAAICTVAAPAAEGDVSIRGITFESEGSICEEAYQGGATAACLFDGDTLSEATAFDTAGVLLVKNTQATATEAVIPACSFTLELSEQASVSAIKFSLLHQVQAMIGVPESVKVEYSEDDETYYNAGTFPIDTTADIDTGNFEGAKVEDVTVDVSDFRVNAKYILLTFTFGDIPAYKGDKDYWTTTTNYGYTSLEWIGFTEIGVQTAAPAEESSETPVDTSSETTAQTSSAAPGGSSSPASSVPTTGDSGLTALIVIAVAAIAAAVLVTKKRT